MILLTDEDIDRIYHGNFWQEIYRRGINPALKAQLKKAVNWSSEYCESQNRPRRECGHCWQTLLKEVE